MAKYRITPSSKAIIQLPISIGHKAEKGVEAIEFDLTAWVETYGFGTLTVIMRRWGDAIPYPIALEIDEDNKATWTLSDIDTAKAGMAYAQLNYIVGDEVVKKSDIYTFRVMDSLTGEGEPPEAYESWLEHLTHFAAEAMAEVLDIEGIVTDKTLTVDGGIADGKATGDALSALEDQFSEETDKLKADLGDVDEWIGFPLNLFDARNFVITNSNNWEITSVTKKDITFTHKTNYPAGFPYADVDLPSGEYIFNVNQTDDGFFFQLREDGQWKAQLLNGSKFTVKEGKAYAVYLSNSVAGVYSFTNISIISSSNNGKIPEIENELDVISSEISVLEENVTESQNNIKDITSPLYDDKIATSDETTKIIRANGTVSDVGSGDTTYHVVRYNVTSGEKYCLSASANYGNALWCFYDSSDNVVEVGTIATSGGTYTTVEETEVTVPTDAVTLILAYNIDSVIGTCKYINGVRVKPKWSGKKWVVFGDSLTAINARTTKHYFDYVSEKTGIDIVNMGDSGSGYAKERELGTAFFQRIGNVPIDADVITIFGSFNDKTAGLDIGNVTDIGTETIAGCMNTTVSNLFTAYPLAIVGIVTPTPWMATNPFDNTEWGNQYVDMLLSIAKKWGIPVLDLYHNSLLRPWEASYRALCYSKDDGNGTHPDETGHKIIAPRFEWFLNSLLLT